MVLGLAVEPLRLILHAILVIVTLPLGQFSLGDVTISWIGQSLCPGFEFIVLLIFILSGNEFPPQLALVCSGEPIPNMTEGLILVASPCIPKSSIFHHAVVLILGKRQSEVID